METKTTALTLMPSILAIFLIGCNSGGSDSNHVTNNSNEATSYSIRDGVDITGLKDETNESYPFLVEAFGINAAIKLTKGYHNVFETVASDADKSSSLRSSTYTTGNTIYSLTPEYFSKMSIGSGILYGSSTFTENSVFNLSKLQEYSLLQLHIQAAGGSVSESKLGITSTAVAQSSASAYAFGASGSYTEMSEAGIGSASASFNYSHQKASNSLNSGVSLMMSYNLSGIENQIVTAESDMSPYLWGSEINVSDYVNVIEDANGTDITIKENENIFPAHLMDYIRIDNYYGFFQILTDLEMRYLAMEDRNTTLANNLLSHIYHAIDVFYDNAGFTFVSTQILSQAALGSGSLDTNDSAGSSAHSWGLAASFQAINDFMAVSGSMHASGSGQSSFSNAVSNTTVQAKSYPAYAIDVTSWVNTINSALKSSVITPPAAPSLPSVPSAPTLPQAGQPSLASLYSQMKPSLAEFEKVKSDLAKKRSSFRSKETQAAQEAAQNGESGKESVLPSDLNAMYSFFQKQTSKETSSFPTNTHLTRSVITRDTTKSANTYLEENYMVDGYKATPYSDVLPQLNFLPNLKEETLYSNTFKLFSFITKLYNISEYLTYISGVGILDEKTESLYNQFEEFVKSDSCSDSELYCNVSDKLLKMVDYSFSSGQDINDSSYATIYTMFTDLGINQSVLTNYTDLPVEVRSFLNLMINNQAVETLIHYSKAGLIPISTYSEKSGSLYMPYYDENSDVNFTAIPFESTNLSNEIVKITAQTNSVPWYPFITFSYGSPLLIYFFNYSNNNYYVMNNYRIVPVNTNIGEKFLAEENYEYSFSFDALGLENNQSDVYQVNKNYMTKNLLSVPINTQGTLQEFFGNMESTNPSLITENDQNYMEPVEMTIAGQLTLIESWTRQGLCLEYSEIQDSGAVSWQNCNLDKRSQYWILSTEYGYQNIFPFDHNGSSYALGASESGDGNTGEYDLKIIEVAKHEAQYANNCIRWDIGENTTALNQWSILEPCHGQPLGLNTNATAGDLATVTMNNDTNSTNMVRSRYGNTFYTLNNKDKRFFLPSSGVVNYLNGTTSSVSILSDFSIESLMKNSQNAIDALYIRSQLRE